MKEYTIIIEGSGAWEIAGKLEFIKQAILHGQEKADDKELGIVFTSSGEYDA